MTTQQQSNPDVDASHVDLGTGAAERDQDLKRVVARLKEQIADQQQRIESLARGREESMGLVSELRAELALVTAERDELRSRLTATAAAGNATDSLKSPPQSIDELMATFGNQDGTLPSHATSAVDRRKSGESGAYEEMISPDLIVLGSSHELSRAQGERYLVWVDSGHNRKFSLDADLLTLGRSESADIPIDGDSISRIHSRILRVGMDCLIEDAGSRNGTWVNGVKIDRHVLKHGDVIRIGSGNLRYIDSGARGGTSK